MQEEAQEKKEPIYQAPSHEATEAVAAKQKAVGRRDMPRLEY
jgi:hypothetical protein